MKLGQAGAEIATAAASTWPKVVPRNTIQHEPNHVSGTQGMGGGCREKGEHNMALCQPGPDNLAVPAPLPHPESLAHGWAGLVPFHAPEHCFGACLCSWNGSCLTWPQVGDSGLGWGCRETYEELMFIHVFACLCAQQNSLSSHPAQIIAHP